MKIFAYQRPTLTIIPKLMRRLRDAGALLRWMIFAKESSFSELPASEGTGGHNGRL